MKLSINKSLAMLMLTALTLHSNAQEMTRYPQQPLTHHMTPEEQLNKHLIGRGFVETDPPEGAVFSLGEFERSKGVLVRYPFGIPVSLIREMARDAIVTTLVTNLSQENTVRNIYTQAGVNLQNCNFIYAPTDSYWTRDYGPWFIAFGNSQIGIVDFPYNRPRPGDDEIPKVVAESLGIPWFGMNVVQTGGNYMSDSYGMAASTTIAYTENPTQTPAQVNQKMQAYLGVNDYHVVEDPNNTYIDHIDCWGKYLATNKILIRSVPPSHPQYDEIEATVAYFASVTTPWGVPYEIYRVNTPQNQPYTNSFILNNKVFVPIMGSQYDEPALAVYRQAMPGYKIFGIMSPSGTPWESTDALHCRTHEMADPEMLRIRHIPLLGNIETGGTLAFAANVTAYSGAEVIADSVLLIYRINPNPYSTYDTIKMINSMGGNWSATLPAPEYGSTVQYYIHAADASGRSENHPFIGQPDPHEFYIGEQLFAQAAATPQMLEATTMQNDTAGLSLGLSNPGQISLNYYISVSTDIPDTLTRTLTNSPAATAYNYNTLTESGWTSLNLAEPGTIIELIVSYNWTTDNYPSEGSFWAESPSGTLVMLASGQTNGSYAVSMTRIAGEEMQGIWKFWIEDSYGDGGHQAKNISVKFVRAIPTGNWLSADITEGNLAPAGTQEILVTCDATGMELGTYHGNLTILSNDPENPELIIPVTMTVTVNTSAATGFREPEISVYPNPGAGAYNIAISGMSNRSVTIELSELTGRVIMQKAFYNHQEGESLHFEVPGLPQGIYLLNIQADGYRKTVKLIRN
jgi:agmatine/peptidylarginine deiminase